MLDLVAKKLFLTKGKGIHEDRLTSFEYALRDAGIAGTNLVLISSIFPPNAKLISRNEGLKQSLEKFIDFPIATDYDKDEPRLLLVSVDVQEALPVVFDSYPKPDGKRKSVYGQTLSEDGKAQGGYGR